MATVLDTNVLSELLRKQPHEGVLRWFAAQPPGTLFATCVTQAEMMLGARLLPAGKRRHALELALQSMFDEDFAQRLWPFDTSAVPAYVDIVATRRAAGRPVSQFDAQIASIARSRGAALATRNVEDFAGCGIPVVDPWAAPG
jgi:predicted nucleic acid-binding protein